VDIKKEFIAREEEKAVALFTANIARSRTDWDAVETSWDFKRHPLV
jgi:hypothetical protein